MMHFVAIALALATAAVVSSQQNCLSQYDSCVAAGTDGTVCECNLFACTGEDSGRLGDYCSYATASSTTSTDLSGSSTSVEIITGQPSSQPSGQPPVTAPAGSLGLGEICSDTRQCANGAQCFGNTAFTIRTCGSFNAACNYTSQCATNTCNNGLCNGFIAPSANGSSTPAVGPTATGGPYNNGTTHPTDYPPFTGGAASTAAAGILAFAVGLAVWAA